VGSITHCKGFVGAVVAPANQLQAIGFDAERADALDPDLIRLICTPAELEWIRLRRHGNPADWVDGVDWPKAFFSAKEAIHKCIWPLWDRMLDFLDVTIEMDPDRQTFSAHESRPGAAAGIDFEQMRGRVAATERFVFTCAFVESLPQPPAPQSPA
jgi:4'-phosphopantetheinyl transferase EntD